MADVQLRGLATLVFNAVGAMPTDRGPLGKRVLAAAARTDVDFMIGVECDDLEPKDIEDVLDPDVWWWRHREAGHRDGPFFAGRHARTAVSEVRSLFGAPESPVNDPRDILRARIDVDGGTWHFTAAGLHVPRWKEGGAPAATAMVQKSRAIGADLLAGDFNIRRPEMVERYPRRTIRGDEVMHFVANPNRLVLGPAQSIDLLRGTGVDDHPGVRCVVRPVINTDKE